MQRVLIVGGGISGMAAALRLRELGAAQTTAPAVSLLEGSSRLGGPIATLNEHGFVAECGADSFLSDKPRVLDLCRRLGLEHELLSTGAARTTLIVNRGRLMAIPPGFNLMAPTLLSPMLKSSLLSRRGKLRLALEPLIPARRNIEDESIARFVTRRMGREVLQRLAQPLAAGIYTGDPQMLSLRATLPRFRELERRYGSVIRGLRVTRQSETEDASGARWSLFLSFERGMQTLIDALAAQLKGVIRTGAPVREIAPGPGGVGWRVTLRDGETMLGDAVICATPANATARLVSGFDSALASLIARLTYSSAAVINLGYRESDFPQLPRATGFVVPAVEGRRIIAASFSSIKFAGRAPSEHVLIRVFVGGMLQKEMLARGDDDLIGVARTELAELLGVRAHPLVTRVSRWPESMPQYAVGHLKWRDEVMAEVGKRQGLLLAGAAYDGVGIPDCVKSGETAAEAIHAYLQEQERQSAA